mmetsp:Transcript_34883/g.64171  ORF Transcript_34883/g.64171 Transcript_34883/m.64171 type:complete len:582 (-) Transcript_34883:314-2059(-)|eukprot:CAMPEP_0201607502 /NCGR_PEP_ID=MMETSP0492-20130828/6581_1 /ASSEMBLY_ACC=CAM_ASM_000837 /TAXON_ID=420259 /ORGANISM="Thalassiosira gravida, Strain GMp14c1" /LENGTH=581 /DNA_ID=CAMNT_0048072097 /DNA_START=80 /DNA_END=1825 /DNA_ORIENTATION=+
MDNARSLMYDTSYTGPTYQTTTSVANLANLPRFGHESDFTSIFSPHADEQADYAAGLISLFVFLLIIFIFWTVVILVFKCMGQANAGFLSGHAFIVPDELDDETNIHKRPFRVRVVFLVATAVLMTSVFLFVAMGLTNVNNAATTMGKSLQSTEQLVRNAEQIATNLEKVGLKSIEIRDDAVSELDNFCPNNPNIGDYVGMDITGIANQAKTDLTMLADFISDGLEALNENLSLVRTFTESADQATKSIQFWGWEMKLLVAGLFILPSFLAVGVGLVLLDVDVEPYQKALTYFFMPLFAITVIACYVVCCLVLPVSATSADACSGGGTVRGGPDDTVLTVYRNLMGEDDGLIFQFVGFYTQQCNPEYYPFDFLSSYLNDLDVAVDSTNTAYSAMEDNQGLLEEQCGRDFDDVINIVEDMTANLKSLREQAYLSLDLVKCENINRLYVNTIHEAGCTYSVDAMAWIFATSLVISVCGLIMIMLRSAYYTTEYLDVSASWDVLDGVKAVPTKSGSRDSVEEVESMGSVVDVRKVVDSNTGPRREAVAATAAVPIPIKVSQDHDDEFEMGHVGEADSSDSDDYF